MALTGERCQGENRMKTCSHAEPHAAHTYGGRPMLLCPGIGRQDLHGTENESLSPASLPEPTFCIDCGQPTMPGKGSARCPACWQDRCQSYEETPEDLP